MSLGTRTKGYNYHTLYLLQTERSDRWDKNPLPREYPYNIFGKHMQRSVMGFGSLATAIYLYDMITEATLNASHGILNPDKNNMHYFHKCLGYHRYI